jgi:indolepyruvate ferredoxin oxidoreductase alpha subunit
MAQRLLQSSAWSDLMMGNHALVRAMIEAGTRVVTSYPGSPTPEIADAIMTIPEEHRPFYFEFSSNEKVATEVAFGAAMNGHPSVVFFKSVGLNVAADTVVQLPLMRIQGGMVIVLGDDPGANSSQNEQDNRHFARMAYIPVFEPGSASQVYQHFLEAAALAAREQSVVFLRLSTHVCHQRERVDFAAYTASEHNWAPRFEAKGGEFIPITSAVFPMKQRALERLERLRTDAARLAHTWRPASGSRLGVIASGLSAAAARECIERAGADIDLLVLGLTYPLPVKSVSDFLRSHDEVYLLEELDRIGESELKSLAWEEKLSTTLHFRPDAYLMGELDPVRVWALFGKTWPDIFAAREERPALEATVVRVPTFCPGCGHRAAFFAIRDALPPDSITVGDIGCHTMGAFEPYRMGQSLLCMGHSVASGSGYAINNSSRKVIAFVGDSTFYHAAIPAIVNAIYYEHDVLLVVMENGTTAMTGQQTNPSSAEALRRIPIERILEGLGAPFVKKVDCYQHEKLQATVQEALAIKGFKAIIASHPCMLKFTRAMRRKGREMPMVMSVKAEATAAQCEAILRFDCPSFIRSDDGRVEIHPGLCIGDGSCRAASPEGMLELRKRGGQS